jgi:hypothetical protein
VGVVAVARHDPAVRHPPELAERAFRDQARPVDGGDGRVVGEDLAPGIEVVGVERLTLTIDERAEL